MSSWITLSNFTDPTSYITSLFAPIPSNRTACFLLWTKIIENKLKISLIKNFKDLYLLKEDSESLALDKIIGKFLLLELLIKIGHISVSNKIKALGLK